MATILVSGGTLHAQTPEPVWPTQGWRYATPEEQGFDSDGLAEAVIQARQSGMRIHSLMVVRNGSVILDAYFWPFEQGQRHDIASVTKTVTTTLVGVGIGQSAFTGVSQPVSSIFSDRPIANLDDTKRRMTLENLLTMSSGLDCQAEQGEITLSQMRGSDDWTQFMLDLPMREEPGSRFEYCSGGMHLLSSAITEATGLSALDFARRDLFGPMGITDVAWPADAQGVSHGWGDLQLRPVDMAKLGYLWLHRGRWEDRQLRPVDIQCIAIFRAVRLIMAR